MCIVNDFLNDNFVLIVISVYGIPLSKAIMFYCKVKLEWHFHSILTDWNSFFFIYLWKIRVLFVWNKTYWNIIDAYLFIYIVS